MATGSADGFLRCGSLQGLDTVIERRPYHKNCRCPFHGFKNSGCPNGPESKSVKYPIRRSWSEGSLLMSAAASPSPGSSPALPAAAMGKNQHRRLGSSCTEFDEECY